MVDECGSCRCAFSAHSPQDGGVARDPPAAVRRRPPAFHAPPYSGSSLDHRSCQLEAVGRRNQRLGKRPGDEVGAEVDPQQPLLAPAASSRSAARTPRERARRRRRARRAVAAKAASLAPHRQQILVQAAVLRVRVVFRPVEDRSARTSADRAAPAAGAASPAMRRLGNCDRNSARPF